LVSRRIADFLRKHRRLYLDTSIFIYFVEWHPRYFDLCDDVFRRIEEGLTEGVTSTLTMTEILTQPYRTKNEDIVLKFYALFKTYPHLEWIDLTLEIADLAAKLRANHTMKTPDAIHSASALFSGATGIVCNDKAFRNISGIECLILDKVE
jgi:predicted nucleic acid-binding protein